MDRDVQARGIVIETIHQRLLGHATADPHRIAVVAGAQRISYGELAARAERFALRLVAAGLRTGDRVAIVAENVPEYLTVVLGTWRAGGILATVYPTSGATELRYVIANAAPRYFFVDSGRKDSVAAAVKAAGHAADIEVIGTGAFFAETGAPDVILPEIETEEPCLICYTSGSTANPKPVTHSHASVAAAAEGYARVWHLGPQDIALVALPIAWIYGLVTTAAAILISGGTVVLLPRFNPVHVVEAVEREGVTIFPGVTTMFVKLVSYIRDLPTAPNLSSLRFCVAGGEPRNEPVFDEWRAFTGCPVHDVYASSECFPVVTYDPLRDPEPRLGSAGKVVQGAALKFSETSDAPAKDGDSGPALARSPGLMLGYWNEPEMTRAVMTADGWYRTNDHLRIEGGYVYVVGRATDMIIRGGSNVSPPEVEAVLAQHPSVGEVVVVGLPDSEYGQCVAAGIVLRSGQSLDPDRLRAFCEGKLAPYKIPTMYRAFADFPRNANGKAQRREIAPLFLQAERRQ